MTSLRHIKTPQIDSPRPSQAYFYIEDFADFFGYGGVVDNFFETHLKPFVDTTGDEWVTRSTGNVPMDLRQEALAAFQRADEQGEPLQLPDVEIAE